MVSKIEAYKLKRMIELHGQEVEVHSPAQHNEFNEPIYSLQEALTIKGIYHEVQGFVVATGDTGATVKTKPDAMFLCPYEEGISLTSEDRVTLGGNTYKVVNSRDIENYHLVCDLSLELVLT
jgi:hypothetical protein